ncbi:ECF transporter S component [Micromonospora sp. NPDC050397]|uniref:ECF transporter S component n=1 Tax=Micromonospora sp. NPDC050397 TaxID=3364279 RepID=UPI00384EE90A
MDRTRAAIRVRTRTIVTITMASFIGFVAFLWPFVVAPGTFGASYTPPLMFGLLLLLVLAVILAEVADGGIDAKALAMLGVLSAINAALRPLGAGTAGIETVFFILVLAGRVFGPGFGFTLGCTSLFASALLTGGVGPWMPYQMFGCAWVGLFAGLLPRARGKAEILLLAGFGAVSGYFFGFMLNLSFWPFSLDPGSSIAYQPGLSFTEQWQRYLLFDIATSLGWDTGRAVTNFLLILLAGPAALATFRRAARRANFQPTIHFHPAETDQRSVPTGPQQPLTPNRQPSESETSTSQMGGAHRGPPSPSRNTCEWLAGIAKPDH